MVILENKPLERVKLKQKRQFGKGLNGNKAKIANSNLEAALKSMYISLL